MVKVFHVGEEDIPATVEVRTMADGKRLDEIELRQPPNRFPTDSDTDDVIILSPLQAYRLGLYLVEVVEKGYE